MSSSPARDDTPEGLLGGPANSLLLGDDIGQAAVVAASPAVMLRRRQQHAGHQRTDQTNETLPSAGGTQSPGLVSATASRHQHQPDPNAATCSEGLSHEVSGESPVLPPSRLASYQQLQLGTPSAASRPQPASEVTSSAVTTAGGLSLEVAEDRDHDSDTEADSDGDGDEGANDSGPLPSDPGVPRPAGPPDAGAPSPMAERSLEGTLSGALNTFGFFATSTLFDDGDHAAEGDEHDSPLARAHAVAAQRRHMLSSSRNSDAMGFSLSGHSFAPSLLNTPQQSFASPPGPSTSTGLPPLAGSTGGLMSASGSRGGSTVASPSNRPRAGSTHTAAGGFAGNLRSPLGASPAPVRPDSNTGSGRPPPLDTSTTPVHRPASDPTAPLSTSQGARSPSVEPDADVEGPFQVGRPFRAGPPTPLAMRRSASPPIPLGGNSPLASSHRSQLARRSPSVDARSPGGSMLPGSPSSRLPPAGPPSGASSPHTFGARRARASSYSEAGARGQAWTTAAPAKPLLALDLDKTLVATDWVGGACGDGDFVIKHDNRRVAVDMRPGLVSFLQRAAKHFRLAIFTAAEERYAKTIAHNLEMKAGVHFESIKHKAHCERRLPSLSSNNDSANAAGLVDAPGDSRRNPRAVYVKNLSEFREPLSRVLIVDDKEQSFACNPRNGVRIKAYRRPDPSDSELTRVAALLEAAAAPKHLDIRDALDEVRRNSCSSSSTVTPANRNGSFTRLRFVSALRDTGTGGLGNTGSSLGSSHAASPTTSFSRRRSSSVRSADGAAPAVGGFAAPAALRSCESATPGATDRPPLPGLSGTYPQHSRTPVPAAGAPNLSFGAQSALTNASFDWPVLGQQPAPAGQHGGGSLGRSPQARPAVPPRIAYDDDLLR